jgi:ABC-2 type transport system ATP-binding protein
MDSTLQPIIQSMKLTRRFGDLTAVDHLDLKVHRGEIFGLVGPDGAGKTTTLRLLCGLVHISEGSASISGLDVTSQHDSVKDQIGYMAQRFALYPDLTVLENMFFYADIFGISRSEKASLAGKLLHMTRMHAFRDRKAGQLSGGMKQKLALMCTLLHHPQVLFLDEPTNGVDPVSRRDFWAILYQLVKDGLTVFITTAYLDEAERCNRVGLLHNGKLIRCAPPESLRKSMEDPCFEVSSAEPQRVQLALERAPGIISLEPFGSVLHLFISKEETTTSQLTQWLKNQGIPDVSFREIEPSLEDVFIALIRLQEKGKQPF